MVFLELFNKLEIKYVSLLRTTSAWSGGIRFSDYNQNFHIKYEDYFTKLDSEIFRKIDNEIVVKSYPMFILVRNDYKNLLKYIHREGKNIIYVNFIHSDNQIKSSLLPKSLVARSILLKKWVDQNRQSKGTSGKET